MTAGTRDEDTVSITREELDRFERTRLMAEAKQELVAWGRGWGSVILTAAALLGTLGVWVYIDGRVEAIVSAEVEKAIQSERVALTQDIEALKAKAQKEIDDARAAATDAQVEAGKAQAALEDFQSQRSRLRDHLASLEETAAQMGEQFAGIDADIKGASNEFQAYRDALQTQIDEIKSIIVDAKLAGDGTLSTGQIPTAFKRNAAYSVLLFYRPNRRADARALEARLLQEGFRSSATATDLSEIYDQRDPGSISVLHTPLGAEVLDAIAGAIVDSVGVAPTTDRVATMKRGDAQVLLW